MSIIFTSSSTPTSLSDLNSMLASAGGLEGLMNKTIKHSLLNTAAFELCVVTPPDGQRYYVIEYFCEQSNEEKTYVASNYDEAEAFIAERLEGYHAAA